MFSLRRFGIKLGLDVIKSILGRLDHPEKQFSCIHIAGSNGKGSIASALSTILCEAGYRVGLYTSPHLVRFNERIRINNIEVTDDTVVDAYKAVKAAHAGTREPTFFEYTTAMAFDIFKKAQVDWAVIETGMGGRLDATNIIRPEVSVISNISLEHCFYLGNTIAQIAREKGGIIKKNTPVVTGARQKAATDVLEALASKKSAPLYRLGKHFRVRRNGNGGFSYTGMDHQWKNMKTALLGSYQVENAAVVLAACEVLLRKNLPLELNAIRKGLETYRWPGRIEILPGPPVIIIDGAHNLSGARLLAKFLKSEMAGRTIILVVGILDDKPYAAMLRALAPVCNQFILTRPRIDRGLPTAILDKALKTIPVDRIRIEDVKEAVRHALAAADGNAAVCIAGSLYVVGEAKEALAEMKIGDRSCN